MADSGRRLAALICTSRLGPAQRVRFSGKTGVDRMSRQNCRARVITSPYGLWCRWTLVACVCTVAGCSQRERDVDARSEAARLIEPAREKVDEALSRYFGTPSAPVAWEKLPVEFHGVRATIVSLSERDPAKLELKIDYQTHPVEAGQTVVWLESPNADITRKVVSWDGNERILTVDEPLQSAAEGDVIAIDPGSQLAFGRRVYEHNCRHCHGITGDGNGPNAWSLTPKPRDYRLGVFKFTSTRAGRKVRRDDLQQTLKQGITGTAMPSFKSLPDDELKAVVEYVRWLSMRGELEHDLVSVLELDFSQEVARESDDPSELNKEFQQYANEYFADDVDDAASFLIDKWSQAESPSAVVTPSVDRTPPTEESIARGRELFVSTSTKCTACHGESGNGVAPKPPETPAGSDEPEFPSHDVWGNAVQPRNLLLGQFRGGQQPIDVYRRIQAGIKGTPMPGFGTSLSDEQIWDLVNYVLALPDDPKAGQR